MIAALLLLVFALMATAVALNKRSMSKARPPGSVHTLEAFQAWAKDDITAWGTYHSRGVDYRVALGKPVRFLASGPAAYLFDPGGQLVDWTADMGDIYTEKHGFDLSSGHVKNITR